MADTKITALPANTTPLPTDITVIIDDPSGTPVSQKITLANLMALFANPVSDDGDALGTAALKWSDLFLASQGVIDWGAGGVTIAVDPSGDLLITADASDAIYLNSGGTLISVASVAKFIVSGNKLDASVDLDMGGNDVLNVGSLTGLAWTDWTPTLSNMTLGGGAVVARYAEIGKTVHFRFTFTLGSGSAMGTNPIFSLPVTASSAYSTAMPWGSASLVDTGTNVFKGHVRFQSTTSAIVDRFAVLGSDIRSLPVTATAPFTWTISDILSCSGTYEAA